MRRKLLSVVLCVCMMLTMVPFAFAADETSVSNASDLTSALSAGGNIKLTANVTGDFTIPAGKTVTLNLNGKTISNSTGHAITVEATGTLTIKDTNANGAIKSTLNEKAALYNKGTVTIASGKLTRDDSSNWYTVYNDKNATMTVSGGEITSPSKNSSNIINLGTLDIIGGKIDGAYIAVKNDETGTLTVKDGEIQGYDQAIQNWKTATIYGGTMNGVVATWSYTSNGVNYPGTTAIEGGFINGKVLSVNYQEAAAAPTVNIKGGVITGTVSKATASDTSSGANCTDSAKANINITGGVFSSNINGSTEKGSLYVYPSTTPVAKIGDFAFSNVADAVYAAESNDTITLVNNTNLFEVLQIPTDKTVTLDLNGYTIKAPTTKAYDAIINRGTLTVKDSKKTGEIISDHNSGIGIFANSNTTIEYAKITGREGAIGGYASTVNATLTIKDGIFNGIDNAVVIFNGSDRTGEANTITINGGTFNGTIQSNGYVACGIYAPWKDNITVNGGIFNITGGAGIVARAGTVTVTGGQFNTTGNAVGMVGDSKKTVPCSALVFDSRSDYPGKDDNSKIIVQGGKFKSDVDTLSFVNSENPSDTNTRIEVTGGLFTSDPSDYCVANKTGVASNDSTYPYTVDVKSEDSKPATVDSATVPANTASEDPTVKEVANEISGATLGNNSSIEAATKNEANNNKITADTQVGSTSVLNSLKALTPNSTIESTDVAIVYQAYVDVTVTDAKEDSNTFTELTVDLTPMYRVIATTKNVTDIKVKGDNNVTNDDANAILIENAKELNVPAQAYEVTLALPSGFANKNDQLSIKHTKGSSVEYYTGTVSEASSSTEDPKPIFVTFTTNGFSPFTIYAASQSVASVNGVIYPSFQAAVDAAQNNDEITLLKGDAVSATMTGSSKTITVKKADTVSGTVNVTVNGEMKEIKDANGVTFTYTRPSSGSGSTSTTYNVNVNAATNGAVAADKKTASKGTTVTVTATPSAGYVVDAVKVVDKDGKDVTVTVKDGKYVFTMPGSAVTVTATFKAETPAPSGLPFTDVKSGDWFYDAVKYAYEQGLMTGTSATTFAPNGTMNRAMIVTVLYRLEKSPAVTAAAKFTDVPAGQWYSDAVAWAAANNIVNGYDETTFGPMNAVTREQMAAILYRYEQYKGMDTVTLEENLNRFPDKDKISAYAVPALQWAVGQKVINGNADGTLDPTGTATRAQVAQIFMNLLNK